MITTPTTIPFREWHSCLRFPSQPSTYLFVSLFSAPHVSPVALAPHVPIGQLLRIFSPCSSYCESKLRFPPFLPSSRCARSPSEFANRFPLFSLSYWHCPRIVSALVLVRLVFVSDFVFAKYPRRTSFPEVSSYRIGLRLHGVSSPDFLPGSILVSSSRSLHVREGFRLLQIAKRSVPPHPRIVPESFLLCFPIIPLNNLPITFRSSSRLLLVHLR